jgi:hypothetical protein
MMVILMCDVVLVMTEIVLGMCLLHTDPHTLCSDLLAELHYAHMEESEIPKGAKIAEEVRSFAL